MAEFQLDQALAAGLDFIRPEESHHCRALGCSKENFHLAVVGHASAGAWEQPQARIDASRRCVLPRMNKDLAPLKLCRRKAGDVYCGSRTWPYPFDLAPMILQAANATTLS
jgi:hypothetical protein